MTREERERKARIRKRQLTAAGHVYWDLARLANVSYSMTWKWMNAERQSAKIERAFAVLTNGHGATP